MKNTIPATPGKRLKTKPRDAIALLYISLAPLRKFVVHPLAKPCYDGAQRSDGQTGYGTSLRSWGLQVRILLGAPHLRRRPAAHGEVAERLKALPC